MDNNKHKKLFELIESMRFPLIFLVVIAHMVGFDRPKVHLNLNGTDVYVLISEMISHNLARVSVRFYFLVSGYFFFRKMNKWSWSNFFIKLKKKGKTLMLPYVFWNSTIVVVTVILNIITMKLNLNRETEVIPSLYNIFWGFPADFPLWYLRDLMCMILVSPLVYFVLRYMKCYTILLLLVPYLLVWEIDFPGFSTTAFLFFTIGGYFAIYDKDILLIFGRLKILSAIFAILFLFLATYYNDSLYHETIVRSFIIVGVIAFVNFFSKLLSYTKLKRILISLAGTSFFVYVVHEIYIINWLKGAALRISFLQDEWGKIFAYFLVPFICVLVCILIYYLWRKISPRTLMFVTGGRIEKRISVEK